MEPRVIDLDVAIEIHYGENHVEIYRSHTNTTDNNRMSNNTTIHPMEEGCKLQSTTIRKHI